MQKKANYIQHQMIQKARMHMVKWEGLYMHQSNTTNTVHLAHKLQIQNRIGGVEWRQ